MREAKNSNLFTNARKNVSFLFHRLTRNPSLEGHGKVVFHIALEFSDYDEPFVRKSSESGQICRGCSGCRQPALARDGDKVDFAGASGERGTRAAVTQRARIKCVALDKPNDARLRNQARVAEQDVRKRFIYMVFHK